MGTCKTRGILHHGISGETAVKPNCRQQCIKTVDLQKRGVHPSFVEIIKQLTPLDSLIFNHISTKMRTPVINLSLSTSDSDNSRNNWIKNITDFTFSEDYKLISISIDNLLRLGLIEIPYKMKKTDITQYGSVRNSIHFKKAKIRLQKLIPKGIGKKIKIQLNYIQKTALGIAFKEICVDY